MKKTLFLCALLLLSGCPSGRDIQVYRLVGVIPQSDFDYPRLEGIDRIPPPFPPGSDFQIGDLPLIGGEHTIYKFVAEYEGLSSRGKMKFHNLLVMKVNADREILDAFHYTQEWTDAPSLDLFRMQNKGMTIRAGMRIKDLGFLNARSGRRLEEKGRIEWPGKLPHAPRCAKGTSVRALITG